ncbi:MAG: hypothetical protein QXX83_09000 [Thermofilum sp.]
MLVQVDGSSFDDFVGREQSWIARLEDPRVCSRHLPGCTRAGGKPTRGCVEGVMRFLDFGPTTGVRVFPQVPRPAWRLHAY